MTTDEKVSQREWMEMYLGSIRRKWEQAIEQGCEVSFRSWRDVEEIPSTGPTRIYEPGPDIMFAITTPEVR